METTNQNQLSILDNINKPLEEKEIINEKPEEQICKYKKIEIVKNANGYPIKEENSDRIKTKIIKNCDKKVKPYLVPVSYLKAKWVINDCCDEHFDRYNYNCNCKRNEVKEWTKKIANIFLEQIEERIPEKFRNADLNKSLKVIQDYYLQKKYKEKGFFLYGEFGTGKSYNVYALAKYLLANDIDVWIFNLPRLLNVIRASFTKQKAYNENNDTTSYAFVKNMSSIEDLAKKEVLIIDDIGAEKPSDWVAETLYYLINTRYENMKITIFTSNLSLDALADKVGDRIVSRITEMCDTYELKGNDRRLEKPDWNAKNRTQRNV